MPLGQIAILCTVAGVGVAVILAFHFHARDISIHDTALSTASVHSLTVNVPQRVTPQAPITASSIVALLNQQRTAKGLTAFKWITQLDNAAIARANYMVAKSTTSTSTGDPWADITDANYRYSTADISDTWNDSTTQTAVNSLTSGNDANFGYSTNYSDIGAGVVSDTINGSATQLIVVYLANQATSQPADTYVPAPVYTYVPPAITYTTPVPVVTAPSCNYSAEETYTSDYYSQLAAENQRYNTQAGDISSAIAQVSIDGAADSSVMVELQEEKQENTLQHENTLNNLQSTYQKELASINCSND